MNPLSPPNSEQRQIDARACVDSRALIGSGCVVAAGAFICRGVSLGDNVRVGPNVAFVEAPSDLPQLATRVDDLAIIGANSTIYAGVTIGHGAMVQPGSVVKRAVPPSAIVEGNPASIVGYVNAVSDGVGLAGKVLGRTTLSVKPTSVRGVTLHTFPLVPDMRGSLTVYEFENQVPFIPKRSFMVFDVPNREVRGEHAHFRCHQFLICARGSCAVMADDGDSKIEVLLDAPNLGIYLPPMTWGVQYKYSPDALLLVFASDYYDPADYIRSYTAFVELVHKRTACPG